MAETFKFSEQLLQAVSELNLKARRNVSALLAGNYRTAFRGSGMQFKDFRHYEPGDDIRHMSWPVTARTRRPTIKTYEEERELDVVIAIDVSGSSLFGYRGVRKLDMYAELSALLSLAAIRSGDNAGVLLFNEKPGFYLPPRRSRNQVMVGLGQLLGCEMQGARSDLRSALSFLQGVLKNKALILILSDFLVPEFETELRALSKKHELVLLHGFDDAERGMNLHGVHEIWDPETGEIFLLDGNSRQTRRLLADFHIKLSNRLEDLARRSRADYLTLSVEDDYLQRLVHFFRRRGPSRL